MDDAAVPVVATRVGGIPQILAETYGLTKAAEEYGARFFSNNAMPGVMKNAMDWLSRPPADIPRVFRGLPTGIIGATPGLGNLHRAGRNPHLC